ncbi:WLM-domain-containing protein [Hypoxylon crocopeplum]|nr:WLM-domain-containing protein [Hypoxylon crocopeplum]
MTEIDPLILGYSHLAKFPRQKEALDSLKKIASLVKPLMRARGWKVNQLSEFYPDDARLLGLNVDHGKQICLRLRYPGDREQFLPIERVIDTMLHELAHNVYGPHDAAFHSLWDQLRDEHTALTMKGYTGEGFLGAGRRLGGMRIKPEEARRRARATAEIAQKRNKGSGQRLGGAAPQPGEDIRKVIADAIDRRTKTLQGCANDSQSQEQIREIAETATRNGFKTQAEEDAANEAAIAQALWELVEEEEKAKKGDSYIQPSASSQIMSKDSATTKGKQAALGQAERTTVKEGKAPILTTWNCDICTLKNPAAFLCCDACGTQRSGSITQSLAQRPSQQPRTMIDLTQSSPADKQKSSSSRPRSKSRSRSGPAFSSRKPPTWTCLSCGQVREHHWWSCDRCGAIKQTS